MSSPALEAKSRLRQHSGGSQQGGLTRTGSLTNQKSKRNLLNKQREEITNEMQRMLMQLPGSLDLEVRPSEGDRPSACRI